MLQASEHAGPACEYVSQRTRANGSRRLYHDGRALHVAHIITLSNQR